MDISKAFRVTDEATAGKWFDLGDGCRMKIAMAGNERHASMLKRLLRPYRHLRSIPDDVLKRVDAQAKAATILLDWEGVEEDGKPVPYSQEKALEYLTNGDLDLFSKGIHLISTNEDNFLENDRATEKNFERSPDGCSSTANGRTRSDT